MCFMAVKKGSSMTQSEIFMYVGRQCKAIDGKRARREAI